MTIELNCPECGEEYNIADENAGRRFKCKACDAVISVPGGGSGFLDDDRHDNDDDPDVDDPFAAPKNRRDDDDYYYRAIDGKGNIPAIILMVLASIQLVWGLFNTVFTLINGIPQQGFPQGGPEAQFVEDYFFVFVLLGTAFNLAHLGIIIYGSNELRTHSS